MYYNGDILYEGRWGQSIRFGSTAKSKSRIQNNYSSAGNNGDPITIIRNGQGKQVDNLGWFPTVENINRDPSSIYLTAGQLIKIDDLSNFSLKSSFFSISSERLSQGT